MKEVIKWCKTWYSSQTYQSNPCYFFFLLPYLVESRITILVPLDNPYTTMVLIYFDMMPFFSFQQTFMHPSQHSIDINHFHIIYIIIHDHLTCNTFHAKSVSRRLKFLKWKSCTLLLILGRIMPKMLTFNLSNLLVNIWGNNSDKLSRRRWLTKLNLL
jgi:hypothetical protein